MKSLKILLTTFLLLYSVISFCQTPQLLEGWWQPIGSVNTLFNDSSSNILYVGGEFNYVGPVKKNAAVCTSISNITDFSIPGPNENVRCSVKDGLGGWYIGGDFTMIGDSIRKGIAHIDSLGKVTEQFSNHGFLPDSYGFLPNVRSLTLHNNHLFCSGDFEYYGEFNSLGYSRKYIVEIDLNNFEPTNWYPQVHNGIVNDVLINGNNVFISGSFDSINGALQKNIAKLDINTAQLLPWNPNPNSYVNDILINDSILFINGAFTQVSGQFRGRFAAFNINNGNLLSSTPSFNSITTDMLIRNNELFISGYYSNVNGISRIGISSFDLTSYQLTNWDPNINGISVNSIDFNGDKLYIGGSFTKVMGQDRLNSACIDLFSNSLTSFSPNSNSTLNTINVFNDNVLIGGFFSSVYGSIRNNLAAYNSITGDLLPWNPNCNGLVNSLLQIDNFVFVGGQFNSIGSLTINNLAKVNKNTGAVSNSWNPEPNGTIKTLHFDNGIIYLGGSFSNIGSQYRNNAAGLNWINGTVNSWAPNPDGPVYSITSLNNNVFLAGDFITLNGQSQNYLASTDANIGTLNTWNPVVDNVIRTVKIIHNNVYIVGDFTTINGVNRKGLAKLELTSGILNSWNPIVDSTVYTIDNYKSKIFFGGIFNHINGIPQNKFGYVDTTNLITSNINFEEIYAPSCIEISGNNLFVGIDINNYFDKKSLYVFNLCPLTSSSETISACDSYTWPINNQTYTISGQYIDTIPNAAGCDSIITLDLTIIPSFPLTISNTFSLPSDANACVGELAVNVSGNADFELNVDNGAQIVNTSGYSLINNLCPGVHDLLVTDNCSDSLTTQIVIPIDSNYVFNNPFIDSIAVDSLGTTITNCDIYYNQIDTAYIDSIWATGNTVNVIWNIVDSNGSNFDTSSYVLNNGNGVYWLQLSVFCPTKALGDYFTVTEAIYFNNGTISMADLAENTFQFDLYPNPTNNEVTLTFDSNEAKVLVYDTQGKLIQTKSIHSGEQVSLKEVETGVYFFEVITEKGSAVKRVVKG